MKKFALILFLLVVAISKPVSFADDAQITKKTCRRALRGLRNTIEVPARAAVAIALERAVVNEKVLAPHERLYAALKSQPKESIEAIFEGEDALTFEVLDALWFEIRSKRLKASADLLSDLTVLRELGMDHPSLFTGASDTVERLLDILKNIEKRDNLTAGLSGFAAEVSKNLILTEETALVQAIQEMRGLSNASSRFLDGYRNTFSPHFSRLKEMIEYNHAAREIMNLAFIADEPVAYYYKLYKDHLLYTEQMDLDDLLQDTRGKVEKIFQSLQDAYGKDMLTAGPLELGEARLRAIQKKIEILQSPDAVLMAQKEAEADMDIVDRLVSKARLEKGLPARDFLEMHDRELQIRYDQFHRESAELNHAYQDMLKQKVLGTEYSVSASWTVTVEHSKVVMRTRLVTTTDANGRSSTTVEVYPDTERWSTHYDMKQDFTLQMSYQELLDKKVAPSLSEVSDMLPQASTRGAAHADSASNGTPTIEKVDQPRIEEVQNQVEPLVSLENSVRIPVEETLKDLEAWIQKYESSAKTNANRDATLAEVQARLKQVKSILSEDLNKFTQINSQDLSELWSFADFSHYQKRSENLNQRIHHLEKQLTYFEESIRRQIEALGVQTRLPGYSYALSRLDRLSTVRKWKSAGKHLLLTAVIAGSVYGYHVPEVKVLLEQKLNQVTEWYQAEVRPWFAETK